ncbi:MAG: hypothetical protein ABR585_07255 [Gemmatimonadaceae bacterium]
MNAADIDWESVSDDWRTGHPDSPEICAAVVASTRAVWAQAWPR